MCHLSWIHLRTCSTRIKLHKHGGICRVPEICIYIYLLFLTIGSKTCPKLSFRLFNILIKLFVSIVVNRM